MRYYQTFEVYMCSSYISVWSFQKLPAPRPFINQGRIQLDFRIAKEVVLADEVTVEDLQLDCLVLLRQQTENATHIRQCNIM